MNASNCRVWEDKHRQAIAKTFAKVFGDNDAILGGDLAGAVAQIASDAVEIGLLVNEPSVQCENGSLVINADAVKTLVERIRNKTKELQRQACCQCDGNSRQDRRQSGFGLERAL